MMRRLGSGRGRRPSRTRGGNGRVVPRAARKADGRVSRRVCNRGASRVARAAGTMIGIDSLDRGDGGHRRGPRGSRLLPLSILIIQAGGTGEGIGLDRHGGSAIWHGSLRVSLHSMVLVVAPPRGAIAELLRLRGQHTGSGLWS